MSLVQGFKIRYGNADELDNYDPTIQVYENQSFIGGTQYNIFQRPQFDETTEHTILNDENGDDSTSRLIASNRCLIGDGVATIDIEDDLTGTVTAKAYTTASGVGGWAFNTLSLNSGVLTLANNTYYKSIHRYIDGVLYDIIPCEDVASGVNVDNLRTTKGHILTLSADVQAADNRTERTDIPWESALGDRYGYSDTLGFSLLPTLTETSRTADSPTKKIIRIDYTDENDTAFQYRGGFQSDGAGNLINDTEGFPQQITTISGERVFNAYRDYSDPNVSPIAGSQEFSFQNKYTASDIVIDVNIKSGALSSIDFRDQSLMSLFITKINEEYGGSVFNSNGTSSYVGDVASFWNALNGGVDTGGSCPNGADNDYPNTTLGIKTGNGFSSNATASGFRAVLEDSFDSATAAQFLESLRTDGVDTSTDTKPGWSLIRYYSQSLPTSIGDNIFTLETATILSTKSLDNVGGDTFFLNYERIFKEYQDIVVRQSTSGLQWRRYKQFTIDGVSILPFDQDDNTVDAFNGNALTYSGKKQFQAYRLNNQAAYFDTDSYLTPVSGNISGATITDTFGTATWTISGNNIACTASGSCHGIRLDSGQIYTMSEGYFGNASEYIYDASSTSGINLQINGQTTANTWQQSTGLTDFGYDWLSIYGGHRYTNGTASEDIFVPHVENADTPVTDSLLPIGYILQTDLDSGVYVRDGSEWLLASGQISQYRSELDAHTVGTTPFTESKGHYVTETSTGNYTRWVIYPDNLSEPANTVVDFIQDNLDTVAITYQAADVSTLSQMNSSYTKRIKLPATKQNSDLFDYIYDVNNADFGTLKTKKDCEVSVEGTEILRGKAIVEAVRQKDVAESYDLYVQGDNFNLWEQLDEVSVSGLDLGSFTLSPANVESSWDYDSTSGNVVFAPIDFGQFVGDAVNIGDLTPSYFIRNILTEGFQQIGIAYESNFLDSDYAKRLVIPTVGEWRLSDADYDLIEEDTNFGATAYTVSGGVTISGNLGTKQYLTNLTQSTSNPNYNNTTSALTVARGAFAYFRLSALVSKTGALTGGNRQVILGYDINGVTAQKVTTFSIYDNEPVPQFIQLIGQPEVQILPGDIVRPWIITYFDVGVSNITWDANAVYKMPEEVTLTLNNYLPKPKSDTFTVFEVLKGLAQTYNIQFYYNPFSKILKFEPYQDFYSGEREWSDKWDNSKDKEVRYLGLTLTQDIWHKYKDDDSDKYLKQYKESGVDYASYKLELPDNFKRGETTVRNEVFAPTVDRVKSFGTIPALNYDSDNEQVESLDFQLRILYYEGKDTSGTFKMAIGSAGDTTVSSYAYLPRLAFREAKSGANWQSLAYDSTDSRLGLFETYYLPKYRNIYEGVTATYYLNLSPSDIIDEPLTRVINLDGARWYINRIIDYNPISQEATKVELIKVIDFDFAITKTPDPLIDIITGKRFDPVSYKPNRDLPDNAGFDMSEAPSQFVQGSDDVSGSSFGAENQTPKRSATWSFGRGLTSYWSNQYLFGTWNEPNEDAIMQIGGGTGSGERYTAFEVVRGDLGFDAKLSGDKVLIGDSYEASGYEVRSTKLKHGTVDISSGSGYLSFLDVGGNVVFSSAPIVTLTLTEYTEASNYHYYVENVTVSGCDVKGFQGASGMTQTFNYIVIGE